MNTMILVKRTGFLSIVVLSLVMYPIFGFAALGAAYMSTNFHALFGAVVIVGWHLVPLCFLLLGLAFFKEAWKMGKRLWNISCLLWNK